MAGAACRRNLVSVNGLGRSASPRIVARRSRTAHAGTPRSSRLARLAPRPSAAAGGVETNSTAWGETSHARI